MHFFSTRTNGRNLGFLSGLRGLLLTMSLWGMCAEGLWSAGVTWGQEEPNSPTESSPTPSPLPTVPMPMAPATPIPIPQDIMYIPDTDGRLRPVPINVTLKEYLEWLEQKESTTTQDQSEWSIRLLEARGELKTAANGSQWASLQCQLNITVGESPRWNSLPLMLGEGLLAGMTDSEEETAAHQLMLTRDIDSGQWLLWYRGRKTFSVQLELLVPLRLTGDQNQLLLTFPAASRTELTLDLPQADLQVDLASRGYWEKEVTEEGARVRVAGFQQSVDLRWSPDRRDAEIPPIMHVDSQIELNRGGEFNQVQARQKITVDRGALQLLRVKLPAGFQVDGVNADVPMRYAIEGSDPSSLTLSFMQPVQSSVQIDWKLSSPIRRFESQILLEGFAIEGARTQTGRVGIVKSNEWRIGQIPTRSENIYRMNVRDFPVSGEFSQAYRYYSQPYRLALNTQRMEPEFHHATYYQLNVEPELLRMTVDIEITPSNSVLDAVRLDWPELNAGVWIPERILREATGDNVPWQIEGDDKLLLSLPDLREREVIRLEASRKIPPIQEMLDRTSGLRLTLPLIATSEARSRHRILRLSSPLALPWEARLEAEQIDRLSSPSLVGEWQNRRIYEPRSGSERRHQWYRLPANGELPQLRIDRVEREISVTRTVELLEIDPHNRRARYAQRFRFHVSRLPLETLRLIQRQPVDAPSPELDLQFTDSLDNELAPPRVTRRRVERSSSERTATPRLESEANSTDDAAPSQPVGAEEAEVEYELEFSLRSQVPGEFVIIAYRSVALPAQGEISSLELSLPLLEVAEIPRLHGRFRNRSAYQATLSQPGWFLAEVVEGIPLWLQERASSQLAVSVDLRQPRIADTAGPVAAEVQSWISRDGQVVSQMLFQMARTPPAFVLTELGDFELISAFWASEGQSETALLETKQTDEETVLLFPPSAIGVTGRLVLAVRQKEPLSLLSLWRRELKLPQHSLAGEISLLDWNVHLPRGIYLFSPPQEFTPNYAWRMQSLGLRRVPVSRSHSVMSADANVGPHPTYGFSSVGWPQRMSLSLIGRGMLMTLGAGLPLLVLVLLTGRSREMQLRGLLGLLVVSVTWGVLNPEAFLLLLQPALFSLVCIGLATWLWWKVRQRQEEPTLIIIGPGGQGHTEGVPGGSLSEHGVGSDDITRIQSPPRQILESSHTSG